MILNIRYARAPSVRFAQLLGPGALLNPLLVGRSLQGMRLDVHLRRNDCLKVYAGLTCIVQAELKRDGVKVYADRAYAGQPCGAGLFRTWQHDEPGFAETLEAYYAGVLVNERHTQREGAVQVAWAGLTEPWLPLDRECVLEYGAARRLPCESATDLARPLARARHVAALVEKVDLG
jgi:hypothetical protein